MRTSLPLAALLFVVLLCGSAAAQRLDMKAVNEAQPAVRASSGQKLYPAVIKAQILLDRARFSPGEIDGKPGENFRKALAAFSASQGAPFNGELSKGLWEQLAATNPEPVLATYTLSPEDVRGPFVGGIPKKLEAMKDLPALGYTSARERLAEKFHMSEELLAALNPDENFETPGKAIVAANALAGDLPRKAVRLEIDKTKQAVSVFDRDDKLLAVYPATVGSADKPAPSGRLTVRSVSQNPTYRYNPKYGFKGVRTDKPFTIKPGPNNPVGLIWIGLKPGEGYGIHGTPDPSKVSKTESHGCVRLTNWDALRLAASLSKGAIVEFKGDETAQRDKLKAADATMRARPPKARQ